MLSKLKKLKKLERSLEIQIPSKMYEDKFSKKISKLGRTLKMDGFRKGKVPFDVVEQRYGTSVHAEVLNELIQETYPNEITEHKLNPATPPSVSILEDNPKKQMKYLATFEIFPEIKPKVKSWTKFDEYQIKIIDSDIESAIEDITERYGEWKTVKRASKNGDQVIMDFEGFIDNKPFEGNASKDFKLILGSKSMIPGFEDELVGKKADAKFDIKVSFPPDYFKGDLANKAAVFKISLKEVQELSNAKLDKKLFEKLSMEAKSEKEFKSEIKKRMENEAATQQKALTKESIYELLLKINKFLVPEQIVKDQAQKMREESLSRIGKKIDDEDSNDLFAVETFLESAEKRVKLDLLFSSLVSHFSLKVEETDLDNFIDQESAKYKDPAQFKSWVKNQPNYLEQYRMVILEDLLVEKLKIDLKSNNKEVNFSDVAKMQRK